MNVHNLFPGILSEPTSKSPMEMVNDIDLSDVDMTVVLTVREVAGQWDINIHSARMNNAEILLALELMRRNILERMTYAG